MISLSLLYTIIAYGLSSTSNQTQIIFNMVFLNLILSVHQLSAVDQSCTEQYTIYLASHWLICYPHKSFHGYVTAVWFFTDL